MRHYEIVFIIHPDQSTQVPTMMERYKQIVEEGGGSVHRMEDWGRRFLAYAIQKVHKAHYTLMNIECSAETLEGLTGGLRYNDAVLRHLVVRRNRAITEESYPRKEERESKDREAAQARQDAERRAAAALGDGAEQQADEPQDAQDGDADGAGDSAPEAAADAAAAPAADDAATDAGADTADAPAGQEQAAADNPDSRADEQGEADAGEQAQDDKQEDDK